MKKQTFYNFTILISLAIFCLIIYYLAILSMKIWNVLSSSDVNTQSMLIGIILTATISLISLFISKTLDRKNQEQKELRKLRTPVYKNFISFAFKLIFSVKKTNPPIDTTEINNKIEKLTPLIILQSSEETILAYQTFRKESDSNTSLDYLLDLILKMRKDLGYSNKNIGKETLKSLFIKEDNPN